MNFEELGLGPDIVKAVRDCGYETPSPIQEKAIPPILMGSDLVGLAQTGTGKTAGFILPMLEILSGGRARARMPRSLILAPTRELAAQAAENFDIYGKYHPLSKALLVGGESMADQIKLLDKGVDVLIATPGRLLDLFERGAILMNDIKVFVIDEADRMLDMGFIPDIEKIMSFLPQRRQTLMFSATMPPEVQKLTERFLFNPKHISVAPLSAPAEKVSQFLVKAAPAKKKMALTSILERENLKNAFVFLNRKRDIGPLSSFLKKAGYAAAPMHGDMAQAERTRTLQEFKDGKITLLVCSDVAARGLDIEAVSHVINYDVPMHAEDYVHRIGRTGRAGLEGRAWTLSSREDDKFIAAIESLLNKQIPVVSLDSGADGNKYVSMPSLPPGDNKNPPRKSSRKTRPEKTASVRRKALSEDLDKDVVGFGDDVPDFFRNGSAG